jgi:hypothetical protein
VGWIFFDDQPEGFYPGGVVSIFPLSVGSKVLFAGEPQILFCPPVTLPNLV